MLMKKNIIFYISILAFSTCMNVAAKATLPAWVDHEYAKLKGIVPHLTIKEKSSVLKTLATGKRFLDVVDLFSDHANDTFAGTEDEGEFRAVRSVVFAQFHYESALSLRKSPILARFKLGYAIEALEQYFGYDLQSSFCQKFPHHSLYYRSTMHLWHALVINESLKISLATFQRNNAINWPDYERSLTLMTRHTKASRQYFNLYKEHYGKDAERNMHMGGSEKVERTLNKLDQSSISHASIIKLYNTDVGLNPIIAR